MCWCGRLPMPRIALTAEADQDESSALLRNAELLGAQLHLKNLVLLSNRVEDCLGQVRAKLGSADGCHVLGNERQRLDLEHGIHERREHVAVILRTALSAGDAERLAGRAAVNHFGPASPYTPRNPGDVSFLTAAVHVPRWSVAPQR